MTNTRGVTAPSEECPEAEAIITATVRDGKDISVELVWNTPGDLDQTDRDGADMDLHFRHPEGMEWFREANPYDCYFGNPFPDWGQLGRVDDNPSMDLDDTDGAGPERITLGTAQDAAEFGAGYRIAVHYYRADAAGLGPLGDHWGPSAATVRVYFSGVLAAEREQVLEETNDFWDVLDIFWTDAENQRIVDVNEISQRTP